MAYVDPPVEIVARGRRIAARALNERGTVLLPVIAAALAARPATSACGPGRAARAGRRGGGRHSRARRDLHRGAAQPPPDGVLRAARGHRRVRRAGAAPGPVRGVRLRPGLPVRAGPAAVPPRRTGQRDLVLHLPDLVYVLDRKRETAVRFSYDFETGAGHPRRGWPGGRPAAPAAGRAWPEQSRNACRPIRCPAGTPGVVAQARERFARGDLFEVVPSHTFYARCASPAAFFERLRQRNPAPYEFFLNLGEGEYLVGASPEMYVRVTGDRVETCPIAGHDRPRRRPARRRRGHPHAAHLAQGGVRADHVHRRGPQRQVADLRAGQHQGHRPPPDRDVQPAHPHRRPRRGPAAARSSTRWTRS